MDYNFKIQLPPPEMGRVVSVMRLEIDDARTCALCREINGVIFDVNDPLVKFEEMHSGCRGSWGYITDKTSPENRQPDNFTPSESLRAVIQGIDAYGEINAGLIATHGGKAQAVAEKIEYTTDNLLKQAIEDEYKLIVQSGKESIFGVPVRAWDGMSWNARLDWVKNKGR